MRCEATHDCPPWRTQFAKSERDDGKCQCCRAQDHTGPHECNVLEHDPWGDAPLDTPTLDIRLQREVEANAVLRETQRRMESKLQEMDCRLAHLEDKVSLLIRLQQPKNKAC